MALPALLTPILLGTAAFGIAKLAGASTKTAILAGLGTFGGTAALGAINPTMYGSIFGTESAKAAAGNLVSQKALASSAAKLGTTASKTAQLAGVTNPFTQVGATGINQGFMAGGTTLAGNVAPTIASGVSAVPTPATISAMSQGTGILPTTGTQALTAAQQGGTGLVGATEKVAQSLGDTFGGMGLPKLGNAEKIGLGITAASYLANKNQAPPPSARSQMPYTDAEYDQAYNEQRAALQGIGDYAVNQPTPDRGNIFDPTNVLYASKGGIAELKKFKEGGINYLPSKLDHNEDDTSNYVRARGYVEDGTGVGDKDEDTMLAQLADGEFVSRADAILGAGIMSGANPKDMKEMRKKGAAFFYSQQAQLKRIYDLVN
jgi:hypothetical protein